MGRPTAASSAFPSGLLSVHPSVNLSAHRSGPGKGVRRGVDPPKGRVGLATAAGRAPQSDPSGLGAPAAGVRQACGVAVPGVPLPPIARAPQGRASSAAPIAPALGRGPAAAFATARGGVPAQSSAPPASGVALVWSAGVA